MNVLRFIIPKSMVEYVESDSTVRQALEKMRFHRYAAIPVLDKEGIYLGTLRNDDIFKYFLEGGAFNTKDAERDSVESILDVSYSQPLLHSASFEALFERVKEHNFVPVVDDRGCFIGIILRREVMNYLMRFYKKKGSEKD